MNELIYEFKSGDYLNRFLTTGAFTRTESFRKVTLKGNVNEWLKYGFAIHENPCRKEFINKRAINAPEFIDLSNNIVGDNLYVFGQSKPLQVYFPFGNIHVDESVFHDKPTYLRSYSFAKIVCDKDYDAEFMIKTCGGLTVWCNKIFITDFIPFTRNDAKYTNIIIPLKKGENTIVTCLDDFAERDTDYYFGLKLISDIKLAVHLPLGSEDSIDEINLYEKMLNNMCFSKEAYINQEIEIELENLTGKETTIEIQCSRELSKTISPGQKKINIGNITDFSLGYQEFIFTLKSKGVTLKKKLGNMLYDMNITPDKQMTLEQRKEYALNYLCKSENGMYSALAMYHTKNINDNSEEIILKALDRLNNREDCSDFVLPPLLQIYIIHGELISLEVKEKIKYALLNYRYWIDELGDDVMWFFSENHALMFHIGEFIAGYLFPDEIFPNSGLTGREHEQKAKKLLDNWFSHFLTESISEWNSCAYIPIDLLGLGGLYNISHDKSIKEKSKKAIDMLIRNVALMHHKGVVMASSGRAYEKELKAGYTVGPTSTLWVAYGEGFFNTHASGYVTIATSDYIPPVEYTKYFVKNNEELTFQNCQGFEFYANLYSYKNSAFELSTCCDYNCFNKGVQEHICQLTVTPVVQAFVNHPGEIQPYGTGRPSYFAGNGCLPKANQYLDLAIMIFDIDPNHHVDFTHAYIPLMEVNQYKITKNTVAFSHGDCYALLYAQNGLELVTSGACKDRELRSYGRKNVWIIRCTLKTQYTSLDEFVETFTNSSIKVNEKLAVSFYDIDYGKITMSKEQSMIVNGVEMIYSGYSSEGVIVPITP